MFNVGQIENARHKKVFRTMYKKLNSSMDIMCKIWQIQKIKIMKNSKNLKKSTKIKKSGKLKIKHLKACRQKKSR